MVAESEEEKRLSYRLRFETMCRDLGWIPARDYAEPEEKDEYDERQSIIFLAVDDTGQAVGTARIIMPGDIPLPIERHFDLQPRERVEALHGSIVCGGEISRFIVPDGNRYHKHEITYKLGIALIRALIQAGASHAYISADYRFFRLLAMLGASFTPIGEPKVYMGSKTVPAITRLSALAARLKSERPVLHEQLTAHCDIAPDAGVAC